MKIEKFYEFNIKDIQRIKSEEIGKDFTIAIEFELETNDLENHDITYDNFDYDDVDELREICLKELTNYNIDITDVLIKKNKGFINNIIDTIESYLYEEYSTKKLEREINKLLDQQFYTTEIQKNIISGINKAIKTLLLRENREYLEQNVEKYLPKFYDKYSNVLDFVLDSTLERGIEFKPKTYLLGLDKTLELLEDFFNEFDQQTYWKFTSTTGLHINIGVKNKKYEDFNILKGLVILDDYDFNDVPFVFRDMIERLNSKFCTSVKKSLLDLPANQKNKFKSLDIHNLSEIETFFNKFLVEYINRIGVKHFGFNIGYLKTKNYVEYRFIGGQVSKELIISKLLYFCYITHLMTSDYKEKDYHKKAYKFIEQLKAKE
jgi:hypothetical protein